MSAARNILGEEPAERCRVWIHNADDDGAEIRRRIAAGCQLHKVPMEELEGYLFVTGKDDFSIRVATGNGQLQIDHSTVACISETIIENEIDVVIFDPLVTLHGVGENDNVRMSEVIHIFGDIAAKCNCAIELCHHTRKPSITATARRNSIRTIVGVLGLSALRCALHASSTACPRLRQRRPGCRRKSGFSLSASTAAKPTICRRPSRAIGLSSRASNY